jgi:adenine-specific DNA methylase
VTFLDAGIADVTDSARDNVSARPDSVPFRPIQYLGNKLRALPDILDAGASLIGRQGRIADLFTGTTVVAQGFAGRGYKVSAADTQRYAAIFARAMLGIGRRPGESCSFATLSRIGVSAPNAHLREGWKSFLVREEEAISRSDAARLSALGAELPLIWRAPNHAFREHVEAEQRRGAIGELPLLTAIYAGSYFGVRQALILDELRQNTEVALAAGHLTDWQYAAALTAIMSAASAAAHSAGKHFAQPLNAGSLRNEKFLTGRLLQDRRIDVEQEFATALDAINDQAVPSDGGHQAWLGPAEGFVASGEVADLYYLDPPYTAQQYSRFYHVLETICTYEYPQLFENGALTTGLYPSDRYKSAFSSKRRAPSAFKTIISAATASGAAVMISYSQSSAASDGNARMITLQQLLDLCSDEFGPANVEWLQLNHRYRQFNSTSASNAHRDDPEILITCKPR